MPDPFRKTISIVSNAFQPGSERNEILSIELSLDGFSFAILDPRHFNYLMLESYRITQGIPAENLAPLLEDFIRNYPLLLGSFERVNIAWFQPHYVIIPEELFLHSAKESFFRFCSDIPAGHELKTEKLNNLGAYGIYPFPENLRRKLEFLYPAHRLRHTATVLIESILSALRLGEQVADVVLHIRQGHFEMMLLENNRLIFYNSFSYQAFDDLMYFLFYVLEQFGLDARNLNALLAGEISLDSQNYELLSGYFKRADFASRNDIYHYGPEFDEVPHHFFYNLLNLNLCG